jgi:hypothetical protein
MRVSDHGDVHTGFVKREKKLNRRLTGNTAPWSSLHLRERSHSKHIAIKERMILKQISQEQFLKM